MSHTVLLTPTLKQIITANFSNSLENLDNYKGLLTLFKCHYIIGKLFLFECKIKLRIGKLEVFFFQEIPDSESIVKIKTNLPHHFHLAEKIPMSQQMIYSYPKEQSFVNNVEKYNLEQTIHLLRFNLVYSPEH